jgi:ammonium transporter Rh
MGVIETFGYSLNEVIVYEYIGSFDDGGSMTIHSFGAYFGLTVSLFLSSKVFPISNHTSDYVSNIFTMIGTIFLWLFWPSFNFGVASQTFFEQNQVVVNTLLALIGSCLSTIICSSLLSHGINMEDILNATLAGGVAIGASCGLLYHPGVALAVGFIAGVLSTLGFKYLSPKLLQKFRLHDNCGVNNLHGIPGIFGGVMSAIIVAFYHTGYDQTVAANYGANSIFHRDIGSFLHQGGLQIAGTAASIGMGIFFGIVAGMIVRSIYNEDPNSFYKDNTYFENAEGASSIDSRKELLRQAMEKEKLQTLPNSE